MYWNALYNTYYPVACETCHQRCWSIRGFNGDLIKSLLPKAQDSTEGREWVGCVEDSYRVPQGLGWESVSGLRHLAHEGQPPILKVFRCIESITLKVLLIRCIETLSVLLIRCIETITLKVFRYIETLSAR